MIAHKNACLSASEAPNPLERIAIDFKAQRLGEKLPPFPAERPVIVVMEGVFLYLTEEQSAATLDALRAAYPCHTLVCDLMDLHFAERYAKPIIRSISKTGAKPRLVADPRNIFLEHGYRLTSSNSIVGKTLEFDLPPRIVK